MNKKDILLQLLDNCYAPYSHFRVSALLITDDDQIFKGVNVENASYGATICAERVAINNAIAYGVKPYQFKALYVMTDHDKISSCCFLCRQVISEFFKADALIVLMNKFGETKEYQVKDLCVLPFNGDDLV